MTTANPINYQDFIPSVLQRFVAASGEIGKSDLDPKLHHLLDLRASQINQCAYCVKMHNKEALDDGESQERLQRLTVWRHVEDFTPAEKAALAWTEALTNLDPKTDYSVLRADLRSHFSDGEISAITSSVAMINLWNRIQARPRLLGLAYRMLGSMADAEDAVQDTFVKWQSVDGNTVSNPEAFLTTICTNRCLDYLKAAHRKRVDYVGPWIPEPLQTDAGSDPETDLERAQSLTTAFLMLLERLTPKERAAYLLREVFGKPYPEVADTLQMSEAGCRQLVSRAGRFVRSLSSRSVPTPDQQSALLKAFMSALATGSTDKLAALLADSVQLRTDGGGKATAITRTLQGSDVVSKSIAKILSRLWTEDRTVEIEINGLRGLVEYDGARIVTATTLGFDTSGLVDQVFMIRNPEKLARLENRIHHDAKSGALWR
ncbi:unnamed protein product [Effrenium voratum]|uniref:Uncharacterized protein n=1 Tax=Effrenium voratum TaxID=2562239 RepID=A0AA36JLD1_9DINO|nr:unnamed protein product [Effrenium voratum]